MQDGFRQRLVGAVVLICLSLILWPLLFSNEGGISVSRTSQISPAPNFKKFTVAAPSKPVEMPEVKSYKADEFTGVSGPPSQLDRVPSSETKLQESKKQKSKNSVQVSPEKPALNSDGLPVFWALQVASFSQKEKADSLKTSLLAKGYKVDMRHAKASTGDVIRVFIGPKVDRSSLVKIQKKVDKEFNVKSMLVRFTPQ